MSSRFSLKKITTSNELYVALAVIVLCLVIGMRNTNFFTIHTLFNATRAAVVPGIMVFAVMMGIIAGGIDVSFPAIAMSSMYLTARYFDTLSYTGSVLWPILMSIAIGTALGAFNGIIIALFKLPAFIVTLGTAHMYQGVFVWLIGGRAVERMPPPLEDMSRAEIIRITGETHASSLPVTFWFLLGTILIVYFILNFTMLGRGIYAIGGDRVSAERAGFSVKGITIFVYTFIGFCSGMAGILHAIQSRRSVITDIVGSELLIIAACVLGGTNIGGGKGTVLGSIFGLALITIARNNLVMMGIPSTAQALVVGIIIVVGTGISAYKAMKKADKLPRVLEKTSPAGGTTDAK